jgi:hypothetical protein
MKRLQGVFWSANQRFWKQMLMVRALWWAYAAACASPMFPVLLVICLPHPNFLISSVLLLLQASKVPACAAMAKEAIENGMAVVIGLQSTGESPLFCCCITSLTHACIGKPSLHSLTPLLFELLPCATNLILTFATAPLPPHRRGQHRAAEGDERQQF